MNVHLSAVIIDADANNRQELGKFLATYGVNLLAQYPNVDALPSILARSDAPQMAIVNLDPNAADMLKKIAALPRQFVGTSFFVMSQVLDPNLLMEIMHCGVKEFIPLPISEQKFSAALERAAQFYGMGKRAQIIQVIPTIGGCGSTTVACNVAAALAQRSKAVLLDLDLIRGGVAGYFDAHPRYTIADVMDSAEKVDKQLLDNALTMHQKSNLAILARPELPEDTQRVSQSGMNRLYTVLGRSFDFVVIDSVMSIDPIYSSTIAVADLSVIVMQLNIPSCKNAERFVGALRRMGIESNKIRIVVNRYVKKGWDIEPAEVERALGLKITWTVPNDFKNAIAAINYGEPVVLRAPRSEIAVALTGLADIVGPASAARNAA